MVHDLLYIILSPFIFLWTGFVETQSIIFLIFFICLLSNWKKK